MGEKCYRGTSVLIKRILVLCEGQTEETFVNRLLAPHLQKFDLYITPIVLVTKKIKAGKEFHGGVGSYAQIRQDVLNLLADTNAVCITTLLDYYGLPSDFPGKSNVKGQTPHERVKFLETAFAQDINCPRFRPYLSLHEFEALLFVQPQEIVAVVEAKLGRQGFGDLSRYSSPEEIDEGHLTHPSARIRQALPRYNKVLHGIRIAERIGLPAMRAQCPHFASWLNDLEELNASAES